VIGCSLGLYKPILMAVFVIPSRTFLLPPVFYKKQTALD
jgi:hypothetical protein